MTVSKQNNDVVIQLEKRLNINNSHKLKELAQSLFDQGYRRITLDFSRASMIDASGLGKIMMLQNKFKEHQGELRITNVTSKYVQRVFELVQLKKFINID